MSFTDYLGKPVSLTTVSGGPTTRYEGIFYTIDIGRQLLALQHGLFHTFLKFFPRAHDERGNNAPFMTVVKKRPGVPDETYPQEFVMFKLTEVTSFVSPPPVDLTSVCRTIHRNTFRH